MRALAACAVLALASACGDTRASPSSPSVQASPSAASPAAALAPAQGSGAVPRAASQLAPAPAPSDPAALLRENAELRQRLAEAQTRVVELTAELRAERTARLEREQQWQRFTQGIHELSRAAGVSVPEFPSPGASGPEAPAQPAVDPLRLAREKRSQEILRKLRALFTVDEIGGLDLLEAGLLDGNRIGPVVLRTIDADGRPTGVLCAERMHLEGSRAARTLTLVLERGYERRAGVRQPFPEPGGLVGAPAPAEAEESALRRGVRRIELPEIDPTPWIEAVPELFGPETVAPVVDDGQHDRTALRVALNQLLREDAEGGWWRLAGLGGVQHEVLRDVVLDGFDRDGNLERKLFADRLTILERPRGLELVLEQGAQLRSDRKTPFLDGRYRIVLPRAEAAAWLAAGVPLVRLEPPAAPGAPAPAAPPAPKQH